MIPLLKLMHMLCCGYPLDLSICGDCIAIGFPPLYQCRPSPD